MEALPFFFVIDQQKAFEAGKNADGRVFLGADFVEIAGILSVICHESDPVVHGRGGTADVDSFSE